RRTPAVGLATRSICRSRATDDAGGANRDASGRPGVALRRACAIANDTADDVEAEDRVVGGVTDAIQGELDVKPRVAALVLEEADGRGDATGGGGTAAASGASTSVLDVDRVNVARRIPRGAGRRLGACFDRALRGEAGQVRGGGIGCANHPRGTA